MQQFLRAIGLCRRPWCASGIVLAILLAGGLAMAPGALQAQDDVRAAGAVRPHLAWGVFQQYDVGGHTSHWSGPMPTSTFVGVRDRPGPGIPNDRFSVRWTRYIYFPDDGVYRFTLTSDDGSRLFIDDQMAIDAWYDHEAKTFVVDRSLRAGHHLLRLEYYDNIGDAQVQLKWETVGKQEPTTTDWRGEYFNNRELLGDPVLVRSDRAIDFDWGSGSPQPGVVNNDNFSVRWTRTLNLPNGSYRFRATVDDGVRVYVNNQLVIDQWRTGPAATFTSPDIQLAGRTSLRVDYFDATDLAQVQVVYERGGGPQPTPTPVFSAWKGEYYNNTSLAGQPALVRNDADVDFNWGFNSPAPGAVNSDDFSVRWTRTLNFQPGNYRFKITVDDGARLWVNNALIIDQWRQGAAAEFTSDIYLPGGALPIRLEFVEYKENALIQLTWTMIGGNSGGGGSGGAAVAAVIPAATRSRRSSPGAAGWASISATRTLPAPRFSCVKTSRSTLTGVRARRAATYRPTTSPCAGPIRSRWTAASIVLRPKPTTACGSMWMGSW